MASAKIIELTEANTCKICDNALAKYSCPKCNILYCSLACYQSPSHLECSESFYRDNVMEELNLNRNDEESKAKMLEILQKTHENNKISFSDEGESEEGNGSGFFDFVDGDNCNAQTAQIDSDDEENYMDIGERLAGVNLDDAEEVWDKLTDDERQEFVAFLKSEDVTKLIPPWKPWWMYHSDSLVEETDKNNDEYKNSCPKICDSIKDFAQLTSKQPADCVKYNLINILCSYVFTTRYFNGEHADFPHEAVACLTSLSLVLKDAQNFEDFEMAIKSVEQECTNSDWIVTDSENIQGMREDLDRVLRGPRKSDQNYYVLCALSDVLDLMKKAMEPQKNENITAGEFTKKFPNQFPSVKLEPADKIKTYIKKIEYYLSYTKCHFLDHFLS